MTSKDQIRRAIKLILDGRIARIDKGLYQVPSGSKENQVYMIENGKCECMGAKFSECYHEFAAWLFEHPEKIDKLIEENEFRFKR